MARRGAVDADAARRFLEPSARDLHDPFLLHGMEAAVARLLEARLRGERVAIVGDYDVDGITGTALLTVVLGRCGIATQAILPNRLVDGYGFQISHVDRARTAGCSLVVTVDCGTTSVEAVTRARASGLDVIVTDHHLPSPALPAGTLQINPRQDACTYPFRELTGAGLALKLAQAVATRCDRATALEPLLRIACLGTIADLAPLVGENRTIAALGLRALRHTRSEGLRALIRVAGLTPPFRASDVGFRLGPRLNAAGRLRRPDEALELLLTRDPQRAQALAVELDERNRERQAEEQRVVQEARQRVLERGGPLPAILVEWSEGWHRGVVGIAAARIAREFHRPTVLISIEGATGVGSGRSLRGIHLHQFLSRFEHELERFGGHAQAIGLEVAAGRLPDLRATLEAAATQAWPAELLERRHEYELEVAPRAVNEGLLEHLLALQPHGMGNPPPLLRVGPLTVEGAPRVFGRGHLSVRTRGDDGGVARLVVWRRDESTAPSELPARLEVLAQLDWDGWLQAPTLEVVATRAAPD
ncbi:MAG TPA: single-stranded-DNA-specific exonuclease RecJ [Thermoanaerobaculia bacterium]|nr:single-stranded-DNA-specific exonuclease RecJ [Thermoanaerobaculia bacterium]